MLSVLNGQAFFFVRPIKTEGKVSQQVASLLHSGSSSLFRMKFSAMFYTPLDLNDMLEVRTSPPPPNPRKELERAFAFENRWFPTRANKWNDQTGLKTLAVTHTHKSPACRGAEIFICFYLIYFLTRRYLPANPWHFWYYLKANAI